MSLGAFGLVAAGGVRAGAAEEDLSASGAGDWFRGTSSAQSDTYRLHKLAIGEDRAVVFGYVPQPN